MSAPETSGDSDHALATSVFKPSAYLRLHSLPCGTTPLDDTQG